MSPRIIKSNPINIFTKIYGVGPKKAQDLIDKDITTIEKLRESDNIKLLKGTDTVTGLDFYTAVDGDPSGISIIPQTSVSSAFVYVGESMLDQLDSYIENILSSSGDIERRKTTLNQDLTDIDDSLLDINRKVDVIRERYLEQFSAMESAVTNLKGTGEYLENMVKSWSKDDN